ncbi:LiaI-LiaF-like domain-containing protein [Kineothrix sp. MB12-C1]|uniref:LiaI-LiaF-like domain-containing protein n=1 Tax=Kineothrix sp. MB12-C1 TaxID=3070215 RepID=UPI0027D27024|nr:DUF5668 domain-containing protein [Kineothrix sp. MB12-C1]WMC93094.1 DUF5668 domain-containing protein [Kineothrix sp. MB12-C1]
MEQTKVVKTHRIGTVTFGILLVLFGLLFLANIWIPQLSYQMIFRLWPFIFIFLGLEVLAGNRKFSKLEGEQESVHFVYDSVAIVLIICLSFFAMIMAAVDYAIQYGVIM